MSTAITATFLSDEDLSEVRAIVEKHGLPGFDASIRLWGRGKAIEVKGTLGARELSCLLAIARFLGSDQPSRIAGDSIHPPTACGALTGRPPTLPGAALPPHRIAA